MSQPTAVQEAQRQKMKKNIILLIQTRKISIHPTIFKQTPMQCDRHNGGLTVLCNDIDISSYVGDISWQNTKDTLATLFNFSVPKAGDMKYINMYKPQEGDIIRYSGGTQEDFRGV